LLASRWVGASLVIAASWSSPLAAQVQAQGSLSNRLDRLERTVGSQGLLEFLQRVEILQGELRKLRGEIENQTYALEQLRNSQREAYAETHRRLKRLEGRDIELQPRAPEAPPAEPPLPISTSPSEEAIAGKPSEQTIRVDIQSPLGSSSAISPEESNLTSPSEPDAPSGSAMVNPAGERGMEGSTAAELSPTESINLAEPSIMPSEVTEDNAESEMAYREAFRMLKAGQYDDSIVSFDNFLKTYPSSQYADNAQYWLGETYYVMRQFELAITHYKKLVSGYPESKKRSHAMLKLVYCYQELGRIEQVTEVLTALKELFPNSRAYRLAEERMQHIGTNLP